MSDTPRTDAEECEMFIGVSTFTSGDVQQAFDFARQLERELNAANQRIQSLIEERDKANRLAEWKWNLRHDFESLLGTDKIEEGIEAVKELKRRIQRLEEAVESLLPYAEATKDESSEWSPGWWKSEKLKRIINEARKAKEDKP